MIWERDYAQRAARAARTLSLEEMDRVITLKHRIEAGDYEADRHAALTPREVERCKFMRWYMARGGCSEWWPITDDEKASAGTPVYARSCASERQI